jgi:hypothetical protein
MTIVASDDHEKTRISKRIDHHSIGSLANKRLSFVFNPDLKDNHRVFVFHKKFVIATAPVIMELLS